MDRLNFDRTQQLSVARPFTTSSTSSWSTISTSPHRIISSNYDGRDSNHQPDGTDQATSELIASLHSSSMQQWHSLQDFVDSFGIKSNLSELHSGFSSSRRSLAASPSSLRAPPNSPVGFEHHESVAYQLAYAQRPPRVALCPRMKSPLTTFSPRKSSSFEEMLVTSTSDCGAGGRVGFGAYGQPQRTMHPTLSAVGGQRAGVPPPTQHYALRNGPPLSPVVFNTSTTSIPNSVVGSSGGGLSVPMSSIPPVHNRNYQEARYKTELCLHYREKNACPHGAHCLFAHGVCELRPYRGRHPKHKSQPCKSFHETGYCNYGYRCSYIHLESPGTIRYLKSLNDEAQKQRNFTKQQQLVSHREHRY